MTDDKPLTPRFSGLHRRCAPLTSSRKWGFVALAVVLLLVLLMYVYMPPLVSSGGVMLAP